MRHVCAQVRNLRERLEEEHQALLTREQDKAALELRISRLTKLILHSTRIGTSSAAARKQRMNLLRSFSEHLCPTVSWNTSLLPLLQLFCDAFGCGCTERVPESARCGQCIGQCQSRDATQWFPTAVSCLMDNDVQGLHLLAHLPHSRGSVRPLCQTFPVLCQSIHWQL